MANANNGGVFKLSLQKWAGGVKDKLEAIARQSCMELAERVVNATPVDTGFLRGSWQPSIGGPASFGAQAETIAAVVSGLKLGEVFMMRNNAVYAMRIEYGFVGTDSLGRHYNQQGRYFVTQNVAAWPTIVADMAEQLK